MPFTRIGASAKEFLKLAEYAQNFELLEIDLEKAFRLVEGGIDEIVEKATPFMNKVYSIHLRYEPQEGLDAMSVMLRDMELIKEFGAEIGVTHTVYPTSPQELEEQLRTIGDKASQLDVHIAVENLGDRQNKTKGCIWPRDPVRIAEVLDKIGNEHLGLCLDTGHAIGNRVTYWNTDVTVKWIKHTHYNNNVSLANCFTPVLTEVSPPMEVDFRTL